MSEQPRHVDDAPRSPRQHTAAEWTTLILSSVLIAAVVAAVVYLSVTRGDAPPAFHTTLQPAEARAGRFYVPVTVSNTGDVPAQEIRVRVELRTGETIEVTTFTIELLAAGASGQGTAVFGTDPAQGTVQALVESFLS
ncbi:MAG: hypothetical protein KC442_23825 [Thermomicrobiales bacterium]|nr:hypothetical protein [Thermomicrobiales bacterium]